MVVYYHCYFTCQEIGIYLEKSTRWEFFHIFRRKRIGCRFIFKILTPFQSIALGLEPLGSPLEPYMLLGIGWVQEFLVFKSPFLVFKLPSCMSFGQVLGWKARSVTIL